MKTGMLWFDNSAKPLDERVRNAAAYYQRKYGAKPDRAFGPVGTAETVVDGIEVRADKSMLPSHLWIGVEDQA
jgi:hypothetical protein